ncbi:MAG: FAD-dependent oxidoreductase [Vampirovibrionales bacterium]
MSSIPSHRSNPSKTIVIIGGVAGGMSAAARLRRLSEDLRIIVFERSGYVSFANCGLPYHLGGEIPDRKDLLLQTPEGLAAKFNLEVHPYHEVVSIEPKQQYVTVRNVQTQATLTQAYDELILSVGATPLKPESIFGIHGEGIFTLRTIEDLDTIQAWCHIQSAKHPLRVVIAGSGFIGLEVAEQLHHQGHEVHMVEGNPQVLKPLDPELAQRVQHELETHGIRLHLQAKLKGILPVTAHQDPSHLPPKVGWVCAGDHAPIPADMVLLGLGVRPELHLATQAGVALGEKQGIKVDQQFRTSVAHIWAVGDVIEVTHPISQESTLLSLGGPANRQGRMVTDAIMGQQGTYKGTLGTATLRVFSLTVATTGLNEKQLRAFKLPYEAIHLHPNHHAGYYPGAKKIALKVLFHPKTSKLYGAQAVGQEGVDKRIEILATALLAEWSIQDLAHLELCYAPPIGSAKDPINLAGMMGENIVQGLVKQVQWYEIPTLDPTKSILVDVRDQDEREQGYIPNSLHVPFPELRTRYQELPKEKNLILYCMSGQRSYFASRFLAQHGYQVSNLAGAYLTYAQGMLSLKNEQRP